MILIYSVALAYPPSVRESYGALALAFLGLSSAIPTLATAFVAGAVADRYDRGGLMRSINLVSILATVAAAADLALRPASRIGLPGPSGFYLPAWLFLLYPCWAVLVVTATLFRPAFNSSVPRIVGTSELGAANGVIYSSAALLSAGATLVVGALLSVAPADYAFAVPFALFFATQVVLVLVRADLSVAPTGRRRSMLAEAKEGFVYLARRRELLEITVAALLVNFLSAVALVELGLYVGVWLGLASGIWYGAVVTASTLGVAVGFVVIPRFRFEPRAGRAIIALTVVMGIALFGLGLVRSIWLALPIMFVYGMMPGMIQTVVLSTIQATVPDAMMGRVFSADEVGSYALVPAGQLSGGLLTVAIGVQGTYLAAGATIGLFGIFMAASFGALRRLGYRPHVEEPPEAAATG